MFNFKNLFKKKQPAPVTATPAPAAAGPISDGEKKTRLCIVKCLEFLTEKLETVIPEAGKFAPVSVYFDKLIPDWFIDQCAMRIRVSALDANQRVLEVFATFPEDDRMISNYFHTGTNEDLKAYMANPALVEEVFKAYEGFSESIRLSD